jgi:hypothetical protein
MSLTAACTSLHSSARTPTSSSAGPTATLTGLLLAVGGPAPGSPRPISGSVDIAGPATKQLAVGPDGKYTAVLPAGVYMVTGGSPQYGSGTGGCQTQANTVSLAAGHAVTADVYCSEK